MAAMTPPRATTLRWMATRCTASNERPITRAAPNPTAVPTSSGARLGTPQAIDAKIHQAEKAPRATRTLRSPREGRRMHATATAASSRGNTQASGRKNAPLRAAQVMPAPTAPRALRRRRSVDEEVNASLAQTGAPTGSATRPAVATQRAR